MKEQVVLLHGIWRTSRCMRHLAKHLDHAGYDVYNLDYPSCSARLESLSESVWDQIQEKTDMHAPLHFVGFSMGGLVTRHVIATYNPPNLASVVMLGTPNQGAELAGSLSRFKWFKSLYGPAGQELDPEHLRAMTAMMEPVNYQLGVIAGNLSLFPSSWGLIPSPNDGMVSVESTKCEGMRDHLTIHTGHALLPMNRTVHKQTEYFLKHREFSRQFTR
jgi:triacylglycerol lipase